MQRGKLARRSRTLPILATVFIGAYFLLFSYDGLNAYFTFDDGMNLVHLHRLWETPLRSGIVDALKVFTAAYRPLGALVYRPLYNLFGFNPLPFRIVCYFFLVINIGLAYKFARALDATPEAAALSTLLFCYNASMIDLYYNTGTVYDLLCFTFYIGAVLVYVHRRAAGRPLSFAAMALVMLLFLSALDSKEMAVTLPAALLLYEILYRYRDHQSLRNSARAAAFLVVMFAIAAAYLKVKLAAMSSNTFYHPNLSVSYILTAMGHYFEQLFYLTPGSFGPVKVGIAIALLLAAAAAFRNRTVAYGTLFFTVGLVPLSVIVHRSGYAAYVAYPGLTLALATILASARSLLVRRATLQTASVVALFLGIAAISISSFAHTRKILMSNALWDQERRIDLLTNLTRQIPEFPSNARILMLDDPWTADWGPMFLAELMYHDPSLWMDRVKNGPVAPHDAYDLLLNYKQPFLGTRIPKILGVHTPWEIHWIPVRQGELTIIAPGDDRALRNVGFSPPAARAGRAVTVTVPGLSNVAIDVVSRVVSNGSSVTQTVEGWCTLDKDGACTVAAPYGGPVAALSIDWLRPSKGRWIFTNGVLTLVE